MFLSFIVPVYNVEQYLDECLRSLVNQDIPPDDYEIICINDGSTDGSLKTLQSYAQRHQNIRVIDKVNEGVSVARNVGLDKARGEYIWMVDSDDFIAANCLGSIKARIIENHLERLKIGTYRFGETLTAEEVAAVNKNTVCVNSHFYDSSVCNSILSRRFLQEHLCCFHYPELTNGEDSIFMFELTAHSPLCTEMDIPIYFYRTRPNSATTANADAKKERRLNSYFLAAQIMKRHYDNGTGRIRDSANLLMSFIWYTMNGCALLSGAKRKAWLRKAKQAGLYPFVRPDACSHIRSYQTTRTDIIGKIYDKVYINTHRPWGFWTMCGLAKLIEWKHRLK